MEPIRLSELRKLSPEEQAAYLERCAQATELNGELDAINARIARLEQIYEMSSETLLARMRSREQRETNEICTWLMLLDLRKRVRG